MKTAGIIAEYNPFHNGHLYQIQQARALTGAEYVAIAMSGDFTQRGEPAVFDKYTRTRMALASGADLILELPVCFATGSAEDFAACGVALLDRLGIADTLVFGSEQGDLTPLALAAKVLEKEPEAYTVPLREGLRRGLSFPKARALALEQYLRQAENVPPDTNWAEILSSPNNILGIEYLKALKRRKSSMNAFTIRRAGLGYHDESISEDGAPSSASAIRKAIREGRREDAESQIPADAREVCSPVPPVFPDDLTALLNDRLLGLSREAWENKGSLFAAYADVSAELSARLAQNILHFDTFTGRIMQLKTKGYTYTRVSRALLHILLGITAGETARRKSRDYVCHGRILGFRSSAAPLLSELKKRSALPLITKTADAPKLLKKEELAMLQEDFYASHLYQSLQFSKSGICPPNEYTRSVIIV